MKKVGICLLALLILLAGCAPGTQGVTPAPTVASSDLITETPSAADPATEAPTGEASATPEPYDDVDIDALCGRYGLKKYDVIGKKELFRAFSAALESNNADRRLGEYKGHVYRLFPVLAAHEDVLDRDYFFDALSALTIRMGDTGSDGGWYFDDDVRIVMSNDADHVVYHELMHFIDFRIAPPANAFWRKGFAALTEKEYEQLPEDEKAGWSYSEIGGWHSDFLCETGAELYAAKYGSHAITSYFDGVSVLTGLEYLFGEDVLENIFFSPDSDVLLMRLFDGVAYTENRYYELNITLNAVVYPKVYGDRNTRTHPEDHLIELYQALGKGDWEQDDVFTYILACYNGIAMDTYRGAAHAKELENHVFKSFGEFSKFEQVLRGQTDKTLDFSILPPPLLLENGETFLTCTAHLITPDGETQEGIVRVKIDLETLTVSGWEFMKQRI